MPSTASAFTHATRSAPKNPLSHERILRVCHAYRTLHDAYIAAGGKMTPELYATMLEIEREIITWEQRSAKLRYESTRQSLARQRRRDGASRDIYKDPATSVSDGVSDPGDPGEAPQDDNDEVSGGTTRGTTRGTEEFATEAFDEPNANANAVALPESTKAALAKYREGHQREAPKTNLFKKSGLV